MSSKMAGKVLIEMIARNSNMELEKYEGENVIRESLRVMLSSLCKAYSTQMVYNTLEEISEESKL